MFFVGHISIAFILSCFIVTRFQIRNISLSLILFLSILPDIDILFRFLGTDIAHRSVTHSIIVFSIILSIFLLKYRRSSIMVYSIAYLSHIAIGDLIIGPLNVLYPFGTFYSTSGIDFKTSEHLIVEGLVLAIMATIVVSQYLCNRKQISTFPFEYSKKLDPIFYPMVIAAMIVSPAFLLDESQKELLEFPNTFSLLFKSYYDFNTLAILALHVISTAIVVFIWIITKRIYISNISTMQQHPYEAKEKQHSQYKL